jgi:hypothetical protein
MGSIFLLSSSALLINHYIYRYPGNNYFPDCTVLMLLALLLMYSGTTQYFDKNHRVAKVIFELLLLVVMMSLVCLAANAVQYTPFPPMDATIVAIEHYFKINMADMLAWTHQHPHLDDLMGLTYDCLTYQMCFIPLLLIFLGKTERLREYYFILLFSTLIGFTFYYFYPTTAPASVIKSPYFSIYEVATGLKFEQIHHYVNPTTIEGGLIAFPSFHTIWALTCVYLLKDWPKACALLLIINCFMLVSCVLLGWHYVLDIVSGVALFALSYYYLNKVIISAEKSPHF